MKEKNIKVSVIIPVYNVENYLSECIESISNQSLKDIEIICINDGSTDNSLEVMKQHAKLDERIKIFSQKNKGLAATRNVGITKAQGKYVYFMDSDDYLELNALEDLYNICEENHLDFVMFKLINFEDGTDNKYPTGYYDMTFLKDRVGEKVFNYKDVKDFAFEMAVSAPGKLFKYDLIKDMRFPEGLIFEDNVFFTEALFTANRIIFYDKYLYNRRIRPNSITTSYYKNYSDAIPILNMMMDVLKRLGKFYEMNVDIYNRKFNQIYFRFTLIGDEYKPEFFEKMKNDFVEHKQEYESDSDFEKIRGTMKNVFYSTLSSNTYREFELNLELNKLKEKIEFLENKVNITDNELQLAKKDKLDLEHENNRLKQDFSIYKSNYKKLKQNEYEHKQQENEIKDLEKEIEELKKENFLLSKKNKHFESTKAYKFWRKYADFKDN